MNDRVLHWQKHIKFLGFVNESLQGTFISQLRNYSLKKFNTLNSDALNA